MSNLADTVADFLRHGQARGWSPITVANYRQRLDGVVRVLRGRGCRRMADVTPGDLDALLQEQAEAGMAMSSRVGLAILVRSFCRWCQEQGRIVSDPARTLPMPDDGEPALLEPPLSASEVQALLAGLPRRSIVDVRDVCFLELLYGCGLRRAEALRVQVDDVNLVQRTVWVRGKGSQNRLLPLMGSAITAVRDWLAVRRSLLHGPDQGVFFITREGQRMANGTVDGIFREINAARGPDARHLHPHLLRHSIAVHLLRGGADVRHIQAFLGHACLNTTKIYLRLVPGRLKDDYEKAMPEIAVGGAQFSDLNAADPSPADPAQ